MADCVFLVSSCGPEVGLAHIYWQDVLVADVYGRLAFLQALRGLVMQDSPTTPAALRDSLLSALERLRAPWVSGDENVNHWLFAGE